jgi:hypothetical protein
MSVRVRDYEDETPYLQEKPSAMVPEALLRN